MQRDDDWQGLAQAVTARLVAHGIDVVHPFAVGWVNDRLGPTQRLPDHGRRDALGLLIGNSRALWAPFVDACRADAVLRAAADPLERYCETHIGAAVGALAVAAAVRWAHGPAPHLPVQRLASLSGLAATSPVGLSVHPRHGPWFALRAVVVLDRIGPSGDPPPAALPCPDCAHTCVPPFERARAAQAGRADLADTWRLWLAVRDACPVGRASRYDDAQIRYHYTKDRAALHGYPNAARMASTRSRLTPTSE